MIRYESSFSSRVFFYVEESEKPEFDRRRVSRASTVIDVIAKVVGVWRNIEHDKLVSTQNR